MTAPAQLMNVIELIARALNEEGVRYVFAGSLSSFIQGCKITPGDIDILVSKPEDVHNIGKIFEEFLTKDESLDELNTSMEDWYSSASTPTRTFTDFSKNHWTFARLVVHGIVFEAACIQPPEHIEYIHGSGFWENGPHVWEHIVSLPYKDMMLPVIPLEIQLETNMSRNIEERINKIISIFQTEGYNEQLVDYALNEKNRLRLKEILA
ncbi:hypothetical protein ACFSVM_01470 [Paenibacillus shunpengii]|uniref:Uncharacterized protein n=1 Tax=Paenibacillus shunpengii TaxID=2054424 RepID=A0ABW5SKI0_9BACL|nr:hypothetical protein [Paenibacillus sp. PDC88]SDX46351.1 hypothetical protein SAMN05518848_107287 [Paenibacillus sp. PDC88]